MKGLLEPRGLWEGGGLGLIAACELRGGLGHLETRARVGGTEGSLVAERTVGGGWACGDWNL